MKLKKRDNIIVIAGKHKGAKGTIASITGERVIVDGVNKVKHHIKPKTKGEKGSTAEREASLHISNVMLVDSKSGKGTRIGSRSESGTKVRYEKKSGSTLK